MTGSRFGRKLGIAAGLVLPLALAIGMMPALSAEKPAPADLKKHETTPGGQYQPSQAGIRSQKTGGVLDQTFAFDLDEAGLVRAIYVVRNPDKLRAVGGRGRAVIAATGPGRDGQ